MTRIRCAIAVLLAFAFSGDASSQFIVGVPAGIGFRYQSGGLRVGGFIPTSGSAYYPYGPYYPFPPLGYVERRVTMTVMPPPVVIVRRPAGSDLSGIDLDIEPASKIWGEKPALARKSEKVGAAARVDPEPERKAPPIPPAPPKPEPIPEGRRLTDLGTEAFRNGEYNLAIRHFRQLAELSPLVARPLFLEAQALIAVGKYRDAVFAIEQGLKRHPEWPSSAFRPKTDLYDNDEAIWAAHRKQLEAAHRLNPISADSRFLLGYLAWFEGQREVAVEHFQEARALAPDARWSDLFLKVAKK
jgi:tetratricopeptide (TPR) repeat protein